MATNPWDAFPAVGQQSAPQAPASPRFPGIIQGAPAAPDPVQIAKDQQDLTKGDLDIQAKTLDLQQKQWETQNRELESKLGKEAGFYLRALRAGQGFEQLGVGAESQLRSAGKSLLPDEWINALTDKDRQTAEAYMRNFAMASLRYESGAAIPDSEIDSQIRTFFPVAGDGPDVIQAKADMRRDLIESLRLGAGPKAAAEIDAYIGGLEEREVPVEAAVEQRASPWGDVFDAEGNPLGPEGGLGFDAEGNQLGLYVGSAGQSRAEEIANDPRFAEPDAAVIARQGFTLGLSDEAAGIGGAIGNMLRLENPVQGYQLWRDVEREQLDRARGNMGGVGTAIEIGSGFGGIGAGANALLSVGGAARQGAGIGALGGFGYGEGAEGSAINALGGAALGGAMGAGGQAVGNALSRRSASTTAQTAQRGQRAEQLTQAGQAEGVTVNRAMVDPAMENRVTGVDATLVGGPKVQREMRNIEGQIEGRVADLGQGGRAMNEVTGGQAVERAGKRFIEKSGQQARQKYDRAEKLAGNAVIEPKESLRQVDEMIATLSETPGQNSAEIAFLETMKGDLGKGLSVGALRRMRTSLRGRVRNGGLTFGEDEARVLGIMDAAADDIRNGLTAQGNQQASRAFDAADTAYRARMDYINGTLQKVMGRRNANQSAEQTWRKFEAMASSRGDAVGLKKFYATLTPEERLDVAATFADDLGKNNAGEFSVAHFLSQTEKLSDDAIKTVFGAEGARSVQNLRTLGKEVKRVTGAMNSRKSGTGVANSYRGWLFDGLLGAVAGGGGMSAGGLSGAAIAGGATALGANALRNAVSARMLTSTKFTNWLKQAPNTQAPAAINRHFERLGEIAKAEPALAGDIEILRNAVMQAANDNSAMMSRSVAENPES